MKCPKCQRVQADSRTECTGCGLIFAKYQETETASNQLTYEVVPRNTPWSAIVFGILMICGVGFFVTREPRARDERKPTENAVAIPKEQRVVAQLRGQSVAEHFLNKVCMDDALNGGLSEVEAKAMSNSPSPQKFQ